MKKKAYSNNTKQCAQAATTNGTADTEKQSSKNNNITSHHTMNKHKYKI